MATSDVISIHVILSKRTRGLITRDDLARMKPSSYLINTARGPIVDEDALLDMLREKKIAGAGLDTYSVEPLPVDHPIRKLDNVVLTPHLGYVTEEGLSQILRRHGRGHSRLARRQAGAGDRVGPSFRGARLRTSRTEPRTG